MAEQKVTTEKVEKVVKPKPIQFYFVKSARKTFYLLSEDITIQAKDKVYIAKPEDPKYARILEFLRAHRGNTANGGAEFYEVAKGGNKDKSDKAVALDNLMDMDATQIRKMVDGGVELATMTKGELILKYMTQQGV